MTTHAALLENLDGAVHETEVRLALVRFYARRHDARRRSEEAIRARKAARRVSALLWRLR